MGLNVNTDSYTNGNGHVETNGHPTSATVKTTVDIATLKGLAQTTLAAHGGSSRGPSKSEDTLLAKFLQSIAELEAIHNGSKQLTVDGQTLTVPAITALARHRSTKVSLSTDPEVRARVDASRAVIQSKVDENQSIYGVSTGYGGSADTRTINYSALGLSLLQHQHVGVLPTSPTLDASTRLPLSDPFNSTVMPEAWVRAAILVRANSLSRGHSGVRAQLIEALLELLRSNVTPLVPVRGTISASGDLQPLSYVAGTLIGAPSIRVFSGPERKVVPSNVALAAKSIEPIVLLPKEHLGLLNGTAFSAALASLALNDTLQITVLAEVLTAFGTEALLGTRASHAKFIHEICRPHAGQVEVAQTVWWLLEGSKLAEGGKERGENTVEEELTVEEDNGKLRQDRYPLRTSPQFLGPQIEDILIALKAVEKECNTTTDNPLVDPVGKHVHHGGNFQAMTVTAAMEKTRLALFHIGKLMFTQSTELCNPAFNRGLPPSVASTDPSLNYHAKGLDIATAAYVGELGFLASPVGVHAQSAEMHNQAVNSLALISARATVQSLEVLSLLMASYLYILCQAVDLRAMQSEHVEGITSIVREELNRHFAGQSDLEILHEKVLDAVTSSLDSTSTMDVDQRMETVAAASSAPLVDHFTAPSRVASSGDLLGKIAHFRSAVSSRSAALLKELRVEYLHGKKGAAPASSYLGRTKSLYEYVRITLGVQMHGRTNLAATQRGLEHAEHAIGGDVSKIYESIRDGRMATVIAGIF